MIESMIWEEQEDQASCLVTIGAGIEWHHFVEESVKRNLAGVECLVGIPSCRSCTHTEYRCIWAIF